MCNRRDVNNYSADSTGQARLIYESYTAHINRDRGGERQFLMLVQEWRSCACSSKQRTLACYPPPAQVFSQQLPNQNVICFFRF
jgi:hypothetical protein